MIIIEIVLVRSRTAAFPYVLWIGIREVYVIMCWWDREAATRSLNINSKCSYKTEQHEDAMQYGNSPGFLTT